MSVNTITIAGRMTRDPELRYTDGGKAVTSFTLAVNRTADITDFIDCVAWEKKAQLVSEHCHKGSKLTVSGRLQIREWEDKNGNKRRTAEIIVNDLEICFDSNKSAPAIAELPDDDEDELPWNN